MLKNVYHQSIQLLQENFTTPSTREAIEWLRNARAFINVIDDDDYDDSVVVWHEL